MEQMLLNRVGKAKSAEIDAALKLGAYAALEPAFRMRPADVVHEVKQSGLRGRGGAGFPTGLKWEFCATVPGSEKYLLCNADEGEPGTFKDRFILEHDPHLLIEGMIISAYAIGATQGYIYIRAEYPAQRDILEKAVAQAYMRGYLGSNILGKGVNFDLAVHTGAGAYICGEETALIESLEGKRGQPRMRPPFPAIEGAWRKPTVVNNVETLAAVPFVITLTAEGFQKIGEESSPGPKLFAVSGAVNKPGGYELPMGTTLRELIFDHCGGISGGRRLKAVIPGGASTPMLTADHLDVKLDFKSLVAAGSMLGSGAVIVMDDSTCMVSAAAVLIRFFKHESCGKCTPCREGTGWLYQVYRRMLNGQGRDGDADLLLRICDSIQGKCFCPLGEGAIQPVLSSIRYFRADYEKCAGGGCGEKVCRPMVH
ncbi:MAG: NADH oxidoreductase (quinone) subunit F [Nitrospirae bacterium GWC2_57_13]|jgi:NADH-quinone oxidoreductase subunit F|nr:MAG: NADH oxidoreductase (quinone) subunit F [Nitrospirae bacterium GWC2_57_13]OGW43422.1 MAG: NADH oxidoreductase (quinone) subunit F [Nitrospirae bacterium GWD2_57_8]